MSPMDDGAGAHQRGIAVAALGAWAHRSGRHRAGTEGWRWGRGGRGQLGYGIPSWPMEARPEPVGHCVGGVGVLLVGGMWEWGGLRHVIYQ